MSKQDNRISEAEYAFHERQTGGLVETFVQTRTAGRMSQTRTKKTRVVHCEECGFLNFTGRTVRAAEKFGGQHLLDEHASKLLGEGDTK